MEYVVAIPSYRRPQICKEQTLAVLERLKVSKDKITVFVANEEEEAIYRSVIGDEYKIVVGVRGISSQRKFIHNYYPVGTRIISSDDDMAELYELGDGELIPTKMTLDEIAELGFKYAEQEGAKLWGINPVANGFFMKDVVTVGLRYICGNFYGNYAGDPAITGADRTYAESSGDDYETTLRSFIQNGSVVRFEFICPKTKYFAAGGIDAELKTRGIADRQIDHADKLKNIVSRYPELASITTKAGGVTNIRLKSITYKRLKRGQ